MYLGNKAFTTEKTASHHSSYCQSASLVTGIHEKKKGTHARVLGTVQTDPLYLQHAHVILKSDSQGSGFKTNTHAHATHTRTYMQHTHKYMQHTLLFTP